MSFEQDFMDGYNRYTKYFDKWCERASKLLGVKITQCGIVECDSTGNAFVALNRPDFGECYIEKQGYLFDRVFAYSNSRSPGFYTCLDNTGVQLLQKNEKFLFDRTFDLWFGLGYLDKIDNDTHRYYFFSANTLNIYAKLLNNKCVLLKLIHYFKQDVQYIIDYYKDRKFNIANKKPNYFLCELKNKSYSNKSNLTNVLHSLGLLDDMDITEREWLYLNLYIHGKSTNQISEILGVSIKTVKVYLEVLKAKLLANNISQEKITLFNRKSKHNFAIH